MPRVGGQFECFVRAELKCANLEPYNNATAIAEHSLKLINALGYAIRHLRNNRCYYEVANLVIYF